MEAYAIRDLTFQYPERDFPALHRLTFSVGQGQFVVLCGSSGCGKTTLLRQLKASLAPHGIQSGEILFHGKSLKDLSLREESQKIGFVMQNPDNQLVTDQVWHELAFGLESLGEDSSVIRLRVAETASFFGMQTWFHQPVSELSGGQKQLLNLASITAMQPTVLILDEPTSQLDPIAATEFLNMVGKMNRELGITVIITEHRLEEVFPHCDRVIVMEQGKIIADGTAREIGRTLSMQSHSMAAALPVPMRVYETAGESGGECPVTVCEGKAWLSNMEMKNSLEHTEKPVMQNQAAALEYRNVWFRYGKNLPDVVKGLSLQAYPGEIFAVLGGNGTGKTTALLLAAGINKPYRGSVYIHGKPIEKSSRLFNGEISVLPQNPQTLFVKKTLLTDLTEMTDGTQASKSEREARVAEIAQLCGIHALLNAHPYDLSGGEQQRAALAKVLLRNPKILLLDEPTKGLDAAFKKSFAGILRHLTKQGVCVVLVSHDIEFCAEYADRCALFFDGSIVSSGVPRSFFSGNSFYTTAANRMARHALPEAITAEDIIFAIGGKQIPPREEPTNGRGTDREPEAVKQPLSVGEKKALPKASKSKKTKQILIMALLLLCIIPLTIYMGVAFFGGRKYYFISALILLETMLPFLLLFERRRPQARELIVIAVLSSIAVAGRAAFFMLPHFKPVTAMVIIAGAAFGGETGFLVGAMTGLVSNMFFGQGPWTPWQMLAFGMIGFLAGVLFCKGVLRPIRLQLCLFGFFTTLLIYGGIMNPASVLMFQPQPTKEMFYVAFAEGIPVDFIHAAATVFFLAVVAQPMLEKLDRIKVKYGILEEFTETTAS